MMEEFRNLLEKKYTDIKQSYLHNDLLFNQAGQLNDGPACRCSINARKTGIRHGIFPGEKPLKLCNPTSNEENELYCYKILIDPLTNYASEDPTKIEYDGSFYKFEGFSLLSHEPLVNILPCKMTRFNIEYSIELKQEQMPTNFTIQQLEMLKRYLFYEILELYDLDWRTYGDKSGCQRFHIFPRFVRRPSQEGPVDFLPIEAILSYLARECNSLIDEAHVYDIDHLRKRYKDTIVWAPGYRPAALRVDQIDFEQSVPVVVHFSSRPPQLSYAANPQYQRATKELLKFRHLLANKPKVSFSDKRALAQKEEKLREFKAKAEVKDAEVTLSCDKFYTTGLLCDIIQHAMIIPVVVYQIRFQNCLESLEGIIDHTFSDKYLLQLALTHPSYRENYGTNPDHARNTLNNLGYRQPVYGDNRVNFQTRKRGINTLINIMSRFGCQEETMSNIQHNERLEFLGDAVVEFLTSIHLFFIFPDLEEGGLATYRAALVQNQHLAVLAKKLQLEKFMLYAHGSDLCHDLELRHAMANCFEALMAALFLDTGLEVADKMLANVLFDEQPELLTRWVNYPKHPLQKQHLDGDRFLIEETPRLKTLTEFEKMTGIEFKHVRLLARAFTHRSIGYNNLTLGTNQRMEFLGDTVLQLIASEYLYKHFPGHHEGHLSLLRSSLVNNRTQTVVCDDLGMADYLNHRTKGSLRQKDRADLLEAFIGALYVDGGLDKCRAFCSVCFFPRLEDFIITQKWNDPKSKLQQCCLTLRSLESREPDIPEYRVLESIGPTNTRVYNVAVYFKDRRLAVGQGPSIQEAEMAAATNALERYRDRFPDLGRRRPTIKPASNHRYEIDYNDAGHSPRSPGPYRVSPSPPAGGGSGCGGNSQSPTPQKRGASSMSASSTSSISSPSIQSLQSPPFPPLPEENGLKKDPEDGEAAPKQSSQPQTPPPPPSPLAPDSTPPSSSSAQQRPLPSRVTPSPPPHDRYSSSNNNNTRDQRHWNHAAYPPPPYHHHHYHHDHHHHPYQSRGGPPPPPAQARYDNGNHYGRGHHHYAQQQSADHYYPPPSAVTGPNRGYQRSHSQPGGHRHQYYYPADLADYYDPHYSGAAQHSSSYRQHDLSHHRPPPPAPHHHHVARAPPAPVPLPPPYPYAQPPAYKRHRY